MTFSMAPVGGVLHRQATHNSRGRFQLSVRANTARLYRDGAEDLVAMRREDMP